MWFPYAFTTQSIASSHAKQLSILYILRSINHYMSAMPHRPKTTSRKDLPARIIPDPDVSVDVELGELCVPSVAEAPGLSPLLIYPPIPVELADVVSANKTVEIPSIMILLPSDAILRSSPSKLVVAPSLTVIVDD